MAITEETLKALEQAYGLRPHSLDAHIIRVVQVVAAQQRTIDALVVRIEQLEPPKYTDEEAARLNDIANEQ